MSKVIVGFSTCEEFVSKAIRFFRPNAKFSHTFVVLGDFVGEKLVAEAGTFQVDCIPLSLYDNKDYRVQMFEVEVSGDVEDSVRKTLQLVNKPYGYLQLVGFIWVWFWAKLGHKEQNPFDEGIICSELVYYFLRDVGYEKLVELDLDPNDVAPDHLRILIENDPRSRLVAHKEYGDEKLIWNEE